MTDAPDSTDKATRLQPLAYMPVNPAKVLMAQGVTSILGDMEAFGALWMLALHSWVNGPMSKRAAEQIARGKLGDLSACGVVVYDEEGHVIIPWVEEARTDGDKRRAAAAAKARKASEARWKKAEPAPKPSLKAKKEPAKRLPSPLFEAWERLWMDRRGLEWTWSKADSVAINECGKHAGGNVEEVMRRAGIMLSATDKWTINGASPKLLASRWNQFGAVVEQKTTIEKANTPTEGALALIEMHNATRGIK